MNFLDYYVTSLVKDNKTLYQSFEDYLLILEPAKLHWRCKKLYYQASLYQHQAQIIEEDRLTRLEKHSKKIQ